MLRIRKKIAEYQELFFLVYILIVGGMRALGKGVFDIFWLSAVAFICLGIKLAVTDYSKKEVFWMALFGALVLVNFSINHERTLLFTMISIYGAKNVDLNKVFLWSLWSRVALICGQILLVLTGVVEGGAQRRDAEVFRIKGGMGAV